MRHRLISRVRDLDVKGFRKLSVLLPKWLIPNGEKMGEYVLKTIHGFKLIINPSIDNGVELSLHETGTYEKGILYFIRDNFKKNGCFIDVGANIGLMSIYTADCFPNAKVIAFEAHPKTYELLKENIALNDLTNIAIWQYALGSSTGKVSIYDNWQVNRGGASLIIKTEDSAAYQVEMIPLDEVIGANIPDMIKIDVEGVELEVLKGAKETIRKYLPVLIVEVSDWRKNSHESSNDIVDFIQQLGDYRIFKLSGGKERKSKLIEIISPKDLPEHDNIICIANKVS